MFTLALVVVFTTKFVAILVVATVVCVLLNTTQQATKNTSEKERAMKINFDLYETFKVSTDIAKILRKTIRNQPGILEKIHLFVGHASLNKKPALEVINLLLKDMAMEFKIFSITTIERPDPEDIVSEMAKNGYKPATLTEQLVFLEVFPKFRNISLVAYGSGYRSSDWFSTYTRTENNKLIIESSCFEKCCLHKRIGFYFLGSKHITTRT